MRSTGSSADPPRQGADRRARRPPAGRSPRAISSASATPPAPPSACEPWPAPRASSPRAPTAAGPAGAQCAEPASGRRSRPSSCARGWPPRSCSRSSPASASCPEPSRPRSPTRSKPSSGRRCRSGAAPPRAGCGSSSPTAPARREPGSCSSPRLRTASSRAPRRPTRCSPTSAAPRSATATCAAPTRPTRSATSSTPASRARPSACSSAGGAATRTAPRGRARRSSTRSATCSPPTATVRDRLRRVRGLERAVLEADEAPSPAALARSLARAGWHADRRSCCERLGVEGDDAAGALAAVAGLADPDALPGPLRSPRCSRSCGRDACSARLARGVGRLLVPLVRRPRAVAPAARARAASRSGTAADRARGARAPLPRPARRRPIPRPGDVGRWRNALGELLDEVGPAARAEPNRRTPRGARARARVTGRALPRARGRRARPSSARPASCSSSASDRRRDEGRSRGALDARRARAPRPDRPHRRRRRTGAAPSSATTRPARRSPARTKLAERGQAPAPALHAGRCASCSGIEPVGGLYHPLGAPTDERKPRGHRRRRTIDGSEALELVAHRPPRREELEEALERAEATAVEAAAGMRAGRDRAATRSTASARATAPSSRSAGSSARSAPSTRRPRTAASGVSTDGQLHRSPTVEPEAGAVEVPVASPRPEPTPEQRGGDRRARPRRLPRGRRRHRQDPRARRALLRRASPTTGSRPTGILAFTFTERAAAELRPRIRARARAPLARRSRARRRRLATELLGARAGHRARLDHDDPRLLPPAARRPPGRRRARPALPGPRREPRRRGLRDRAFDAALDELLAAGDGRGRRAPPPPTSRGGCAMTIAAPRAAAQPGDGRAPSCRRVGDPVRARKRRARSPSS